MTLPNYISLLRIVLVPIFIASIVYYVEREDETYRYLAIAVFGIASLSDALDGYLARHFAQESRLGSVLDPLADKLLLVSGIVILSLNQSSHLPNVPIWLTTLIISRDAFLSIGTFLITYTGNTLRVKPRLTGKAATVSQMALILWALCKLPLSGFEFCVWMAGILTLVSGIQYLHDGIRQLGSTETERP